MWDMCSIFLRNVLKFSGKNSEGSNFVIWHQWGQITKWLLWGHIIWPQVVDFDPKSIGGHASHIAHQEKENLTPQNFCQKISLHLVKKSNTYLTWFSRNPVFKIWPVITGSFKIDKLSGKLFGLWIKLEFLESDKPSSRKFDATDLHFWLS